MKITSNNSEPQISETCSRIFAVRLSIIATFSNGSALYISFFTSATLAFAIARQDQPLAQAVTAFPIHGFGNQKYEVVNKLQCLDVSDTKMLSLRVRAFRLPESCFHHLVTVSHITRPRPTT
jgi:hypothetical protein